MRRGGQRREGVRKQDRDWVGWRSLLGENVGDIVPPELEAESADGRGGDSVGYAGELDIQSADSEICGTCGAWDKCL